MTTPSKALGEVCADVRPGGADDAVQGVAPAHVAAPATVAEASALMRIAAEHGLAVVARGAGTRLDWGAPPRQCDLLVDTHRLDRVIEHAAGDLVVKVEAGLPLHRLGETLEASGQRLALDLPLAGSTVGGTLATAAAGPLRLRYGTPRDLLIGVTIIRADGAVAKAGGKVVKNVAGYDLGKLVTGSYGTLGLIVEAAFRLHPLPRGRAFVTAPMAGAVAADEAVQALLHSAIVPSAIEVDAPADGPITVGVLVEGAPAGVTARTDTAAALLGTDAEVGETAPSWWGRALDGQSLIELRAKPTDLSQVLKAAAGAQARGSAGNGVWQLALPAEAGAQRVAEVVDAARALGHAVVLTAPPEVRERLDMWGPVPALALMHRVKDQFDPEHRLSPGRFAGGI
ncbi:FAD-binding oxidoreductase [Actinomadura sp. HBU206391]|uniref:FAD-binding oxidoreductase n=1 Tax=Actinomadura sp. HBU206391 TaxID=2731692 RepID=UPI00164F6478|nr:FAD-binding oxidoreductase [Actinomadura sp. HBU206391]MBC6461912.1 FAD-binding oxidoreductase [Actinomadura sp. HBU206391]